jgi:excisionase family DNA binding protein
MTFARYGYVILNCNALCGTFRYSSSPIYRNGEQMDEIGPMEHRKTYTVTEMAKLLGIGRTSAYEAVRTGQIPTLKIGKRVLVPRAALERLLENPPTILPAA